MANARPGLSDEQRLAWLRLARTERVGAITFRNLINRFGSAEAALDALPEITTRAGARSFLKICSYDEASREIDEAMALGVRHIAFGEPDYPQLLRHIPDCPPLILVSGNLPTKDRLTIALVGSRNASTAGQKIAALFSKDLAQAGYVTVSGLARGIDTIVHEKTLQTGTIAVIAGGHRTPYPPENADLSRQIVAEGGAVISERAPSTEPRGQDFPRRNRIISGLSLGVIVIEAAARSGTLITARLAAEQNREVFAVPGSPLDPRAQGTNDLIRKGATLVRNADDVISDLSLFQTKVSDQSDNDQTPFAFETEGEKDLFDHTFVPVDAQEEVLASLSFAPVLVDDIIQSTGLSAALVRSALCDLELSARIMRHDAGLISLAP